MNKRVFIVISTIIVVILISVFSFYFYLGIGFGNAVIKTAKGVKAAKKEWIKEETNPIDSIKYQVKKIGKDSIGNEEN